MRSSVRYWMASLRCLGSIDGSGFEIGDGASDFEDAVVGARGKAEALDSGFKELLAVG